MEKNKMNERSFAIVIYYIYKIYAQDQEEMIYAEMFTSI